MGWAQFSFQSVRARACVRRGAPRRLTRQPGITLSQGARAPAPVPPPSRLPCKYHVGTLSSTFSPGDGGGSARALPAVAPIAPPHPTPRERISNGGAAGCVCVRVCIDNVDAGPKVLNSAPDAVLNVSYILLQGGGFQGVFLG